MDERSLGERCWYLRQRGVEDDVGCEARGGIRSVAVLPDHEERGVEDVHFYQQH